MHPSPFLDLDGNQEDLQEALFAHTRLSYYSGTLHPYFPATALAVVDLSVCLPRQASQSFFHRAEGGWHEFARFAFFVWAS